MSGETRRLAAELLRRARGGEAAGALPHLVVCTPAGAGRVVALPAELTLGRGAEAGLTLPDRGASRLHARLRLGTDGAATVEDLGSKNGLRLNGARLRPGAARLRHGDELRLGETLLRFQDPTGGATRAGAPPARLASARFGGRLARAPIGAAAALLGLAAALLALP